MKTMRAFLFRLSGLFGKDWRERELSEELESHLRMHIEDNIRSGMTPEQARRHALIKSGGLEPAKEAYRDRRGLPVLETVMQDLRYGVRMIRKSPGFTAVVALTLALGIGANTAIFSVVHAALTPLSIEAPERVVMVWTESVKRDWHQLPSSVPDYLDWNASGVFSSLGSFVEDGFNLRITDRTERIAGLRVSREYFEVLSSPPQLGRFFQEEDLRPGHEQVAIISDALWHSSFRSDPAIIGRSVVLGGSPHTVIGVLPTRFPKWSHEDIYTPLIVLPPAATERGSRSYVVIARLRPGLGLDAAQKRMTDVSLRLARQYPDTDAGIGARLQPLAEAYVQDARTLLVILFGAVGFVLLISCANIANLLLARATARGKEMAIRAALGASRWKLSRQLLTESILLAILGGCLAVLPALWGIDFIASFHLDELPNADLVTLNPSVLVFNLVLSVLTGILFGLVPAWQLWKTGLNDTLKTATRSYAGGRHQRLRGLFVVSEVALTLVLLVGAGLMLQSLARLRSSFPGYESRGVLTMKIALSDKQYASSEKQVAFFERIADRARGLPGVLSVGAADELPTSDDIHGAPLFFADRPEPRTEDIPVVLRNLVTRDYFRTMHIPLIHGRYPNESDGNDSRPVAVVDEWTAKRYWPNQDPIGRSLKLGRKQPYREIVGVVGSVEQGVMVKVLKGRIGQIYLPFAQESRPRMSLVARTEGDPASLISAIRNIVRDTDVDQPVFQIQTMDAARAAGRASQQLVTWLLGGFAVVALQLATIGVYGVIAYSVGQRTREFGIRMSLGARQLDVLRLVLKQGIVLTIAGIGAGLAGAFALTRMMSSLLYGIRPTDALTYAGVTALLAGVALVASYVPARRATKVDPVLALRSE